MERRKRYILIAAIILGSGLLFFLFYIRVILTPFILSIILAYILLPAVKALVKRKVPKGLAILVVYLSVAGAVMVVVLYVFPQIFRELNRFIAEVPMYTARIQVWLAKMQQDYSRFQIPESLRQVIDETVSSVEDELIESVRAVSTGFVNLFSYLLSIIIVPILTYYFLRDHEIISKKFVSALPPLYRTELLSLWATVNGVLRRFIRGHLSVACIVGTLTGFGLTLIGVEYAVTLGFIAGVADIIPYFGPIIGAVPAVCLALLQSQKLAWKVVLVMFIVQQLENSVISPKIIGDSVGLHPAAIIFVLLLGGYFFGLPGMLFAVPATAVLRLIIIYLYQKAVACRDN